MEKPTNTFSLEAFSPDAKALMVMAQKFADASKHPNFEPAHLLAVLLDLRDISQVFRKLGVDTVLFSSQLHGYLNQFSKSNDGSTFSPTMAALVNRTKPTSVDKNITAFELLVALSEETSGITANLFKQFKLTTKGILQSNDMGVVKNRDIATSLYLTNLTDNTYAKSEPIIGRDEEARRLVQILGRRSKNHALLVGEPGVGKRTIVVSLANRINSNHAPRSFKGVKVVQLHTTQLLAGAGTRKDVEDRLDTVLKTLQNNVVVLYVRSIESLMAKGANLNLSDFFGILLSRPNIRVVAACSPESVNKITDKDSHLLKEFVTINVEPTTIDSAIEILRAVAPRYSKHHNIKIGEDAISSAVKLAKRYVQDRFLPESAIDLIDEAASNKKMEITGIPTTLDTDFRRSASLKAQLIGLAGHDDESSNSVRVELEKELSLLDDVAGKVDSLQLDSEQEEEPEAVLTADSIARVLAAWTNMPVSKFMQDDNDKLAKLDQLLSVKVIDQAEAVSAISKAVKRSSLGLRNIKKPIGSFLFFGSSGVGKTLLAKAVAERLFDSEDNMLRIDMSEYQAKHDISKLLGSPPGYEGAEEGGILTESVRKKPYQVLLFDEIEKAHPDIFNVLLQVLDDGRLSDSKGKVVDFSNTIIILTSNIGSKKFLSCDPRLFDTKEGIDSIRAMVNEDINNFFRPEFLNRIDSQVIFKPLSKHSLRAIATLEIQKVAKLVSEKGVKLDVNDDVREALVEIGYNPAFGARPLIRAIVKHIQDQMADAFMSGKYPKGSTISIFVNDKKEFVIS